MLSNHLAQFTAFVGATDGGDGSSFWFPKPASVNAEASDWLFHFIMWISVFFLVLIVGLMVAFVWNYRRRPGVEPEQTATHHTPLELTWTIIPTILVIIIFYFGVSSYIDAFTPPRNAREVQVTGQKWNWAFTYANGWRDSELHVIANEATRLVLRSEDVIHSFYIPAFRMKMDVVPGRYRKMWFTPTATPEECAPKPGDDPKEAELQICHKHQVFCAEYCGKDHSAMLSKVIVHTKEGYDAWLKQAEEKEMAMPPVALGEMMYSKQGCKACHSTDGSRGIAPTFKGLFGRTEHLADGSTIEVDEDYIHESILEPQAKVVAGFAPVMPTFKGKLKDKQIHGIIEWIKTLK